MGIIIETKECKGCYNTIRGGKATKYCKSCKKPINRINKKKIVKNSAHRQVFLDVEDGDYGEVI